ncbi:MAG TPA: thrombospondin type 3 repeat-containing protein, partial [Phycisphaerae bacterium]|nr:thrombospondin type 3 repeat-containing protein [Phycisphaerae bacterium]
MHKTTRLVSHIVAFAGILLLPQAAHAQWTVISLNPARATESYAMACSGTIQVGFSTIGGVRHAGLWSGSAATWVDLNPAGAYESYATCCSGTTQAGYAIIGGAAHAGLWSGSAASWIDLNPPGATQSYVMGCSGATQVGYAIFGNEERACLWNCTAASWVDLGSSSVAYAISGTLVVGSGPLGTALWNGTAAPRIDLGNGVFYATSPTRQAGCMFFSTGCGSTTRATLWTQTDPYYWIDLHPEGAYSSIARGIYGMWQVGEVDDHASLWSGSAESENLSLAMTDSWANTGARGIWSDGATLYIAGYGYNFTAQRTEAVLWSRPDTSSGCPDDPNKPAPGQCGCGVPDTDSDNDGVADCIDACPNDPAKSAPGQCGCGMPDIDSDNDGIADCVDTCPDDPNKSAPGQCGCGVPDTDSDNDGVADCIDGCPNDPAKTAPGKFGCGTPDVDSDGDGIPDSRDNCPHVANADQADTNGNGVGDACETASVELIENRGDASTPNDGAPS